MLAQNTLLLYADYFKLRGPGEQQMKEGAFSTSFICLKADLLKGTQLSRIFPGVSLTRLNLYHRRGHWRLTSCPDRFCCSLILISEGWFIFPPNHLHFPKFAYIPCLPLSNEEVVGCRKGLIPFLAIMMVMANIPITKIKRRRA